MPTLNIHKDWRSYFQLPKNGTAILAAIAGLYTALFLIGLFLFIRNAHTFAISSRMFRMTLMGAIAGFILTLYQFYGELLLRVHFL